MKDEVTDPQWDYLMDLKDMVGDMEFYAVAERVRGSRSTSGLTKDEASDMIDELKERT